MRHYCTHCKKKREEKFMQRLPSWRKGEFRVTRFQKEMWECKSKKECQK